MADGIPSEGQSLFRLANDLHEQGQWEKSVEAYRRLIAIEPRHAEAFNNLGNTLLLMGQTQQAIECFDSALFLRPDNPQAAYNRGYAFQVDRRFEQAIASYKMAIALQPEFSEAWNNLGTSYQKLGRLDDALECLKQACTLQPDSAAAHSNLGSVFLAMGRADEACNVLGRSLELDPNGVEAHNNLGNALSKLGRTDQAMACYRKALILRPDGADIYSNFGNLLKEIGRLDHALACYDRARSLAPRSADIYNNLGNTLKEAGQIDQAIECFRRAIALRPELAVAHSGLLYAMHFHPAYDAMAILEEHRNWDVAHARPLAGEIQSHDNDRDLKRRLRIGYVSADFREHVVGRFLLPLLAHHDHRAFEVFCYSDVVRADEVTRRLQSHTDQWRNTAGLSHGQLSQLVRSDRIDILVDLAMHMGGSRLLAFARRPAPVQVTYLAYCSTTGLETMDWRLTDPYLDPPGNDAVYVEKSWRLPASYWCYEAPDHAGEAVAPPSESTGHVAFGSLNNFCKASMPALEAWIEILSGVSDSGLILHAHEGVHRQRVIELFESRGINRERLQFVGFLSMEQYLAQYHQIDIALDPFPYAGGTTTCDALWMGVPVVTLNGNRAVGRGGASILSNIEIPELIARTTPEYISIAIRLAHDPARMRHLRATMRQRMRQSSLMDGPRFARDVETAYREMWRSYLGLA